MEFMVFRMGRRPEQFHHMLSELPVQQLRIRKTLSVRNTQCLGEFINHESNLSTHHLYPPIPSVPHHSIKHNHYKVCSNTIRAQLSSSPKSVPSHSLYPPLRSVPISVGFPHFFHISPNRPLIISDKTGNRSERLYMASERTL